MGDPLPGRLDQLAEAWNEAEIPRPSLGRWIEQFAEGDQPIALRLLECMQMHGYARKTASMGSVAATSTSRAPSCAKAAI